MCLFSGRTEGVGPEGMKCLTQIQEGIWQAGPLAVSY